MRVSMSRPVAAALAGSLLLLSGPTASANAPIERARHKARVIKVKVDRRLFGVHDAYLNSLRHHSTRSIRLWDTGTQWDQVETTPGHYDWSRLDTIVKAAHANGTEVTLVLGLSPSYAATTPTAPPNLRMYRDYLATVMKRYRPSHWGYRGIANYQVWNEANISTFWTGSNSKLAALTKAAHDVGNQVDPRARIIAPAMVTRLKFEQKRIQSFYRTRIGGRPVWKYVDAISLNLYPTDRVATASGGMRPSTPEDSITLLRQVRARLAKDNVPRSFPIWNTEVNYGMGRTATIVPISEARQVANVMRTFLLNAAQGVKRVDWYAYDMGELPTGGTLGNTLLTNPKDRAAGQLTAAGVAFTRVQRWMHGTLVGTTTRRPCTTDRRGTYTCVVKYAHGVGRIYWNPFRRAKVRLVPSARKKVNQYGETKRVEGGTRMTVNYRPILVKSQR